MNRPRARRVLQWCGIGFMVAVLTGSALAQGTNKNPAGAGQKPPAPSAPPPVGPEQALYLVRSTLMTLNDANRTGNYTVLRDIASPDFAARNTAADLATIFNNLRRRNLDLFAVALLDPKFDSAPALDANGRLRIVGAFQTRPLEIRFDLSFALAQGQWKLFAISVATPPAPAAPTPAPAPRR
jgi:hypothetical protein